MLSIGIFSHFLLNSYLNFFLKTNVLITAMVSIFMLFQPNIFFFFGEQFFEDQIWRSGIRTVPQNSYSGHVWPAGSQF